MTDPDKSAEFRKDATRAFRIVVGGLVLILIGLPALGWWIGRWWGLGIGAIIGVLVFAVGLTLSAMIYAMSQGSA